MATSRTRLVWLALLAGLACARVAAAREDVLILGGAGHSGSAVARMLVARGDRVTVFVRPTTNRSRLEGLPVSYLVGDLGRREDVDAALAGKRFTVIYETVQMYPGSGESYSRVYENVIPWAKRMKLRQFISLGASCTDKRREDCPLSPPLYALSGDMAQAEHILRDSGVPFTVIRLGALLPNPNDPMFGAASGKSVLTTDLSRFGGILRADLDRQVFDCIGARRCLNKIFVADDPTVKPQLDHWLCKRRNEGDQVSGYVAACGPMPPITEQQLRGDAK